MGKSYVYLDGGEHSCRMRECNMGNLVTDSIVHGFLQKGRHAFTGWSRYAIAICPGGTIRTSFNNSKSSMTLGDVIAVLPFENNLVILNVSGKTMREMMEHGVSAYDPSQQRLEGRFPQVSGIRVTYDVSRQVGQRVTSLRVRCAKCLEPAFEDVHPETEYAIITPNFMADGGDGYAMLKSCTLENGCRLEFGLEPVELVQQYLKEKGVVTAGVEDRIIIKNAAASLLSLPALPLLAFALASRALV